jgi:hypothetical protein
MTKPRPDHFQISEVGLRHIPTEATFKPFPDDLTNGSWKDGKLGKLLMGRIRYEADEVKEMGRKLWGEYLSKKKARGHEGQDKAH